MKVIIIILLIAILISLAAGLFFLMQDKGTTKRTVYSLTVRIVLSVCLFLLLLIGYFTGAIQPHGVGG
jgi:hypothetical protein